MSEQGPISFNDEFARFYDQLPEPIADQIRPSPAMSNDKLDQLLLLSRRLGGGPAEFFNSMAVSIPDEGLYEFVGLVEAVEALTIADLEARGEDKARPRAFSPRFEYAKLIADGLLAVPIADRNSLRDYLVTDEVTRALDSHMSDKDTFVFPDEQMRPRARKNLEIKNTKKLGPKITQLDETFEPMRQSDLLAETHRLYWYDKNRDKYLIPEETLEDIVNESTEETLIELLLCVQEDFIERQGNGEPVPIVRDSGPRRYFVEDGIVCQVYNVNSIRFQMAIACRSDKTGFDASSTLDVERFREEYVSEYTDRATLHQNFQDDLDWEIRSRRYLRTGQH